MICCWETTTNSIWFQLVHQLKLHCIEKRHFINKKMAQFKIMWILPKMSAGFIMRFSKYLFCAKWTERQVWWRQNWLLSLTFVKSCPLSIKLLMFCSTSPSGFWVLISWKLRITDENEIKFINCHPCYLQIQAFMYGWLTFYHQVGLKFLIVLWSFYWSAIDLPLLTTAYHSGAWSGKRFQAIYDRPTDPRPKRENIHL